MDSVSSVKRYRQAIRVMAAVMLTISPYGLATSTATIPVTITILPSTCTINGGRPIEVDFGEVMTTRVDGVNYRKAIGDTLTCSNLGKNRMKIRIRGTTSTDGKSLQSSNGALGIRLEQEDGGEALNTDIYFAYPHWPLLRAVPVKLGSASLQGGAFTAAATMTLHYQ